MKILNAVAACAALSCVTACSTTDTSTVWTHAKPVAPRNVAVEWPTLKVVTDCGACQVRPSVPGRIVQGYNDAAAEYGAKVVTGREAVLVIKEYAERDDTARFLVGAFAGKDEIKAVVTYEGKQLAVEDYYRNAMNGIDTLGIRIGQMTAEHFKQ